jgi:hypothetical protein
MIIPWIENGVVISSRDFASYYTHLNKDRDNFASMYTLSGDSLFYMNLNTDLYGTFDKNAAISINELIHFEREISGSSIGMFKFQRLEWLEEKTIKWETPPIQWLPLNSRIDNTSIDKNGNEWHYTWHYTEFSGAKGTYNIKININTGEYRIIE